MKNKIPDALYKRCEHYPYGYVSKYTCKYCLAAWVETVDPKEVEELAEYFSQTCFSIAAERLRDELKRKEKKSFKS
jgi:hypothetical protein